MDGEQVLIAESGVTGGALRSACPRCGEPSSELPTLTTSLTASAELRRCARCGTRYATADGSTIVATTCEECGLPFVDGDSPASSARCVDCRSARSPVDATDSGVAAATEREIRQALLRQWSFVGAAPLSDYLERLVRRLSAEVAGVPPAPTVVLFEQARLQTLALPSGTLLVSVGTLLFLADEAELVFVMAHELAHAATADATERLVRLGLHAVSADGTGDDRGWADAAADLMRLGYGRQREHEADATAFAAVLALGYEPRSVMRYLHRLQSLIERGDPRVSELALAHPPPGERLRRLQKLLSRRPTADRAGSRVNREVFRRMAGHDVLTTGLERIHDWGARARQRAAEPVGSAARASWLLWLVPLVALLTGAIWLLLN